MARQWRGASTRICILDNGDDLVVRVRGYPRKYRLSIVQFSSMSTDVVDRFVFDIFPRWEQAYGAYQVLAQLPSSMVLTLLETKSKPTERVSIRGWA